MVWISALDFPMPEISGTTPSMLNKALHGPNAMHWKKALEYKINQLEKLGTWVIEQLPKGETMIPCTKMLREKPGPNGKTHAFQVWIISGRHKQVEELNYTEMFSADFTFSGSSSCQCHYIRLENPSN